MDITTETLMRGAAGAAGGDDPVYVEEVFSTDVYSNPAGAPNPRTVTNGVNFLEEGGLLWVKNRSFESGGSGPNHVLFSTANSATSSTSTHALKSNTADDLEDFSSNGTITWKTDGWSVSGTASQVNGGYYGDYAAWSFRKAPGFLDIVTWTGDDDNSAGIPQRNISHELGCNIGAIIAKRTGGSGNGTGGWMIWHKSFGNNPHLLEFDTQATNLGSDVWGYPNPSVFEQSSHFSVDNRLNDDGDNYVAYVFADGDDSAAQVFGDAGNESIIKCGTYNDSSAGGEVDLGWEPQWVLVRSTAAGNSWNMIDNMRGWPNDRNSSYVFANSNAMEGTVNLLNLTSTGFKYSYNAAGDWVYVAIRRGPMKKPTDATKVFNPISVADTANDYSVGFLTDLLITQTTAGSGSQWFSRHQARGYLRTDTEALEAYASTHDIEFDLKDDFSMNGWWGPWSAINWHFRRAPGFFDIVTYEGYTTHQSYVYNHNLGVTPELLIFKNRSSGSTYWQVSTIGLGIANAAKLNEDTDFGMSNNLDSADSTTFTFDSYQDTRTNNSTDSYIAYLFASLDGVSKVGTYTGAGSGTDVEVTCEGFTNGARFVMIKNIDAVSGSNNNPGDWFVYDTTSGINVAGTFDPFLKMNSVDAQDSTKDRLNPLLTGFTVSGADTDHNKLGDTYIYLAIA